MLNNIKDTQSFQNQSNLLLKNSKTGSGKESYFLQKKCKINYIISLYQPKTQDLELGITYTKELGYSGVVVKDNVVYIIPADQIVSSMNNADKGVSLIVRLAKLPNSWDLVYDERRQIITVWPKLRAAGKLGEFNTMGAKGGNNNAQVQDAFNHVQSHKDGLQIINSFTGALSVTKLDNHITGYIWVLPHIRGKSEMKTPKNGVFLA